MNDPRKNDAVLSTSAFYRTMGLFRQGKTVLPQARDRGRRQVEAAARRREKPLAGGAVHDELIMWLAYKEAKAMIQFNATPAAPAQPHTK